MSVAAALIAEVSTPMVYYLVRDGVALIRAKRRIDREVPASPVQSNIDNRDVEKMAAELATYQKNLAEAEAQLALARSSRQILAYPKKGHAWEQAIGGYYKHGHRVTTYERWEPDEWLATR